MALAGVVSSQGFCSEERDPANKALNQHRKCLLLQSFLNKNKGSVYNVNIINLDKSVILKGICKVTTVITEWYLRTNA